MNWAKFIEGKSQICVSTDTRSLPEGGIFFALHGANFNGNKFAMQAIELGAAYVVVDEEIALTCSQQSSYAGRIIRTENTLTALQSLAREWRRKWGKTVIGITGTNGKTTTKELTAAVLSTKYNVLYTEGNLNNQVGVPLTLLRLTGSHDIAIIEMGASHPGDIQELVEIAQPDCGLITNVGKAHLQGFGSFEGVQRTKGELYDYLRQHSGFCFRNLDNPYLNSMAGDLKSIGYHTAKMLDGTHLVGTYNSENIQAAIAVGNHFGISTDDAIAAIRAYVPTNNRSQLLLTKHNRVVVDAYNANPSSMQASILNFIADTSATEQDKCLILGDMLELGDYSHTEHQNIVNLLAEQRFNPDNVYLVGSEFLNTTSNQHLFPTVEALAEHLRAVPLTGKHILLKGSRGIHLEKLIELL